MSQQEEMIAAFRAGDAGRIGELLAADPELSTTRDPSGVSLRMLSLYMRRSELTALLFGTGPAPDLFEAASMGQGERLQSLLGADPDSVNGRSPDGFTALHLACFFGREEAVALLLRLGADAGSVAANAMKVAPLHSAVAGPRPMIARSLLVAGADPNARQQEGWTALHEAGLNNNRELAELLIAHGAKAGQTNDNGKTAAAVAEEKGHTELAEWLRRQGG